MNAYHKVLVKLYEVTGGKDTVDVDLADVLKKEGFYPSIDEIKSYLSGESWIAETSRLNIVRITHWGVAEAKRVMAGAPDGKQVLQKETTRLVNVMREALVMSEELNSSPSAEKLGPLKDRMSELGNIIERIKANV
ncbi:MAG TPA: hypothetical protein PKD24_06820 [Pyrinomonadaceae bacterium]|nr:hypothetical protein [Pyrinomonadaceae bacterium]HMP65130.1 hypothetical protein [Pyrinomonadaceae bacterium]